MKIEGKWKDRSLNSIYQELERNVCAAAERWQPAASLDSQRGVSEHAPINLSRSIDCDGIVVDPQRCAAEQVPASSSSRAPRDSDEPDTMNAERRQLGGGVISQRGATEQAPASSISGAFSDEPDASEAVRCRKRPRGGTYQPLRSTLEDVIALRRLGPDLFEATKRSGELWVGDEVLLKSLPQGMAKLATLVVTEVMSARKRKARTEVGASASSTEPTAKQLCTQQAAGAPEHAKPGADADRRDGRAGNDVATAPPEVEPEARANVILPELFRHGSYADRASIEWLRAHHTEPRCRILLQQILEWSTASNRCQMRQLTLAHGINVKRERRQEEEAVREEARKHFRNAIAQEKGRLSVFNFRIVKSASEQPMSVAHDAAQAILAGDVVDLATLKLYRRQHDDLPRRLDEVIQSLSGGVLLKGKSFKSIVTSLNVQMQFGVRYISNDKTSCGVRFRNFPAGMQCAALMISCIHQVRAWGGATEHIGMHKTPTTVQELAIMLREPEARLRCPFGVDWGNVRFENARIDGRYRTLYWLPLMELYHDGYRYGNQSECAMPYVFGKIMDLIAQRRSAQGSETRSEQTFIGTPDDLANALMAHPLFCDKFATHDLLTYALKQPGKYMAEITSQQLQQGTERRALKSLLPASAATTIANVFFDFVNRYSLADLMGDMTSEQIQVIALFSNHLLQKPPARIHLSERSDLLQRKVAYIPSEAVQSPDVPHFVKVAAASDPPKLQAPFVCQLCGDGFVTTQALWKHASAQHHSWAEYRKRLIFEIQRCDSVPLKPIEKRRLAGNFYHDMLYSRPARGTLKDDRVTPRHIVACTICAIKAWIEDFYPCYVWKEVPPDIIAGATEHDIVDGEDLGEDDVDEGNEAATPNRRFRQPSLRDEDGFCYFGPVDQVDDILNVNHYRHVVPLAPLEELHASSVQHPRFPQMRWLMHTRRVPVLPPESVEGHTVSAAPVSANVGGAAVSMDASASEHDRPECAGIGDAEVPCWVCHHCASHLCQAKPKLPPQALANWNWGGREHPKYQNLSMATKSLLGLGKLIARLVLLKPMDNTDDSERALVGNTILVAQSSPEIIAAELPPTESEQAQYFNVVYAVGAAEHDSMILGKKKALVVDRQEYLECAQLRRERCPLFAHTSINVDQLSHRLPAVGVPTGVEKGAVQMETVQYFSPTLAGPATGGTPLRAPDDDAENECDHCDEDVTDAAHGRAPDSLIAEENANAEFLIGLDGCPDDDAVGKLAAVRTKMKLAEDSCSIPL